MSNGNGRETISHEATVMPSRRYGRLPVRVTLKLSIRIPIQLPTECRTRSRVR